VRHEIQSWMSPSLGRPMTLEVFGHGGARVLVFPTTLGSHHEWRDRQMHVVLQDHLDNGWIQLFCLDHVHGESWYNKQMHPGDRARRHLHYDRYLRDEVIPYTRSVNDNPFVIATGASFGAYHAACFAFRNPHLVHRVLGMSGLYDVKHMTDGWSDEAVYACNPFDFMRNESDPARLDAFRRQDIIFAVGRGDPAYENNQAFSGMLWEKGIGNALRIWDGHAHDWPYWERMVRMYLRGHD
jgi:esterase/lipase superfamily enzyme